MLVLGKKNLKVAIRSKCKHSKEMMVMMIYNRWRLSEEKWKLKKKILVLKNTISERLDWIYLADWR